MAASDTEILNSAKDSLKRILDTDTSNWSEGERRQQQLEIDRLVNVIDRYEQKTAATAGRKLHFPVGRVDI